MAETLPGRSLNVAAALVVAGALSIAVTAFGAWPGGTSRADAAVPSAVYTAPLTTTISNVLQGNFTAVPAADTTPSASATPGDEEAADAGVSPDDNSPLIDPTSPEPSPPQPDLQEARSIPLTEADKTLLIKVRQADLWEIPTGEQAQQRASSPIVKQVGAKLAANHRVLDVLVRNLAAELDVTLPSTPSDLQRGWMNELSGKNGADYDRTFALRLRFAHGQVFNIISQVRTGTRNPQIRAFAQQANIVVMRHMTLLESTGLVNYQDLPAPVISPAAATSTSQKPSESFAGMRGLLIIGMLAAAGLIGFVSMRRIRRGS